MYDRIDELLKTKGMSRRRLALTAEIPESTISTAFMRKSKLPAGTVQKLATALGVSVNYLLTGETTDDELLNRIAKAFPDAPITETDDKISIQIIAPPHDKRPYAEILRQETIRHYDSMNSVGQQRAYENVKDLAKIDEYKKKEDDNAPQENP